MARCIDADKTLAELDEFFDTHYWQNTALIDGVMRIVNNQKPADVVPVVHAHWEMYRDENNNTYGNYACTNCKSIQGLTRYKFCPMCGAKMDEEVSE